MSSIEEPAPAAKPAEGEEAPADGEPPAPIVIELQELQRIRVMIDDITAATDVLPKVNPSDCAVANCDSDPPEEHVSQLELCTRESLDLS